MRTMGAWLVSLMLVTPAASEEPVRVARYSTIAPTATAAQADLLGVVVRVRFPEEMTVLRPALDHLLARSGYRLASAAATDPRLEALLRAPIPRVHRRLGPITLQRALEALAGPAWVLVVDPVHRLVSFELAEPYAGTILAGHPDASGACVEPTRSAAAEAVR